MMMLLSTGQTSTNLYPCCLHGEVIKRSPSRYLRPACGHVTTQATQDSTTMTLPVILTPSCNHCLDALKENVQEAHDMIGHGPDVWENVGLCNKYISASQKTKNTVGGSNTESKHIII
jgi:hypothetical protein